jgi:hypothetical protein
MITMRQEWPPMEISKIVFQPWPGKDYKAGIAGHRVLILGESHHHDCTKDCECKKEVSNDNRDTRHRMLTRIVVESWIDGSRRSPVSYRVPELFNIEQKDFWSRVVFYNFLQSFAGPKARVRPSEKQWTETNNAEAFQKILDHFLPDRILVLGKKLWTNLPSKNPPLFKNPVEETGLSVSNDIGSYNDADRNCYWYYARSGHKALAMPIMHPAAIRYSRVQWTEPLAKWLSFGK